MSVRIRWVTDDVQDLKKVGEARLGAFGAAARERERFMDITPAEGQACLLAEEAGRGVCTTTALDKRIWVRGAMHDCQGVAWVGTVRTHRRSSANRGEGLASLLMRQTVRRARQQEQVLTTLMPFRASFYEHFGYGVVERRQEWTVPLALLPAGDFAGIRFFEADDVLEMMRCRQRIAEIGQCDMERPRPVWDHFVKSWEEGFVVVDRPKARGPVHGWVSFGQFSEDGRLIANVRELMADSPEALKRQFAFLASLKDQYAAMRWSLPIDFPLNWLLKERLVGHRWVHYPSAHQVRMNTRMMARVLDHKRLIEAMRLPAGINGKVSVAVHESEQTVAKLTIRIDEGKASVKVSPDGVGATPQAHCDDRTWAAVVLGDLPATRAAQAGVLECRSPAALAVLDAFARGPAPYCGEYF